MKPQTQAVGWEDWSVVCELLPSGWVEAARTTGALRRARHLKDASTLLRVLLMHLAEGCSLKEAALRATRAGWCKVSAVALFKRLRAAEQWLRWMAERLWIRGGAVTSLPGRRLRAVDATVVRESGATGSTWRVHYVLGLQSLQCDHFELTDVSGGETFKRIPVKPGDVLMGDRAYGTAGGVAHVAQNGGEVLVRINLKNMPLFQASGKRVSILSLLRRLRVGQVRAWSVQVRHDERTYTGRLVALRRGHQASERARRRLKRQESKHGQKLSPQTLEAASYVMIFTTVPASLAKPNTVMELYRRRWQIELAFKRMKSILGLGQLPKHSPASSRAWLHGKVLVALLLQQLLEQARSFSPWGYSLATTSQPLARDEIPAT